MKVLGAFLLSLTKVAGNGPIRIHKSNSHRVEGHKMIPGIELFEDLAKFRGIE